jgi:hypothetical protein
VPASAPTIDPHAVFPKVPTSAAFRRSTYRVRALPCREIADWAREIGARTQTLLSGTKQQTIQILIQREDPSLPILFFCSFGLQFQIYNHQQHAITHIMRSPSTSFASRGKRPRDPHKWGPDKTRFELVGFSKLV